MAIRRKKAGCLMILITHVSSIPLSHTKRTPPVIPDVRNRESRIFPSRTFSSLSVRHDGFYDSEVMFTLPKRYASLIEPWSKTVLTGFPLKTAGMTERGPAGMTGRGLWE